MEMRKETGTMKASSRKNMCLILFLLLFCFSVSACSNKETKQDADEIGDNEYCLYYVSLDSVKLVTQKETFDKTKSAYEQAKKMLSMLSNVEESLEYKSALPDKVTIQNSFLGNNKVLTVDFSESYNHAVKSTQLLCKAAMVKSLTQISGIDMVEFTVDSQPIIEEDKAVGPLSSDSFVDLQNEKENKQTQIVTLYYSNKSGKRLKPTRVCINLKDNVKDQVVIYSVVNSLCELPTVSKVSFTINGKQQKLYNGNVVFDQLFERNLDIVEKQ